MGRSAWRRISTVLPDHPVVPLRQQQPCGTVAAARGAARGSWPISWATSRSWARGLVERTKMAILNANYMARPAAAHYPLLYTGQNGLIAHESSSIVGPSRRRRHRGGGHRERIIDYGFHPPTVSFRLRAP